MADTKDITLISKEGHILILVAKKDDDVKEVVENWMINHPDYKHYEYRILKVE
jgi:hypothetical protein